MNARGTYTDRALDPMLSEPFAGRRCLVTGGLGFIGSNLALALAAAGAHVTIVDARVPRHGANPANLVPDGAARTQPDARIAVLDADLGDVERLDVREAALTAEFIFNLAGQ